MSATSDPWIGQTIDGRYTVRRLIGKGGMGAVYEGEQASLGRKVALKFMLREPGTSSSDRFKREARNASQVVHEHVAQVYDVGRTPDGHDYLVMEYVDGTDLAHVLRDEVALPVERAVAITCAILEGLAAIHARGIVHRDVKPSNVLLTTRGDERDVVKLVDFGLARARDDARLTKTGNIVGTTPYMAPEVFRGERVDHRADIYAVGITLYQMLAGKLPFVGATAEIGAQHVWSPPPPLGEARGDLPSWLVTAVERALSKSPADRFADARAMIEALRPRAPAAVAAPAAPAPSPRRWPWLLLGAAVLAGGAVGAYLARPQGAPVVQIAEVARDAAAEPVRDATVASAEPRGDAAVRDDAAVHVTDAGMHHPPAQHAATTTTKGRRCHCMASSGEGTPLCAKPGKPLCRCLPPGKPPLCLAKLVECREGSFEESSGLRYDALCSRFSNRMRCSDLGFARFTRPGVHGEPCSGLTVNYFNAGYPAVTEGEVAQGRWDCDTCPGANNQVYAGVEGQPCTGYHWRTAVPIPGRLRHCE